MPHGTRLYLIDFASLSKNKTQRRSLMDEYKFLGMWMSPNGCMKAKNEKLSMINQWIGRLGSAAGLRPSKHDVLREVRFRALCVVWMILHGIRMN